MKRLGIIGWPVTQSRSPKMFYETFAGRQEILSEYSYDLIIEQSFEKAFATFDRDFYAVNVTAPFKEPAFRSADRASDLCRGIGATNLLIHRDEGVTAYNTDCLAVVRILEECSGERNGPFHTPDTLNNGFGERNGPFHTPDTLNNGPGEQNEPFHTPDALNNGSGEQISPSCTPNQRKILVVGCGGAGKAAIVASLSVGAEVTVANRTPAAVESFMKYLGDNGTPGILHSVPLSDIPEEVRRTDMTIYTLPLPVPELSKCDFTGRTVLEAKYYEPAIKQMPGMKYIPGSEWFRIQAAETYRLLGL